jgi:hypothetical protein
MEINGVGSDPAHIFDPETPLLEMFRAYIRLWHKVFEVSQVLYRRGVSYITFDAFKKYAARQKAVQSLIN